MIKLSNFNFGVMQDKGTKEWEFQIEIGECLYFVSKIPHKSFLLFKKFLKSEVSCRLTKNITCITRDGELAFLNNETELYLKCTPKDLKKLVKYL